MKLDDIAKMAINEVSAELEKIENLHALNIQNTEQKSQAQKPKFQINEAQSVSGQIENGEILSSEKIFLINLKERTEVLFEGLNELPKELVNERLELTLKFLEFVLANVENRLENLNK
ncbi:hypothetical protein U5B43_02415 [Campylobacter sp. 9BO]|uniref:CiaD-like domain-containing protein n=1 Tax=Campylobacter sp. 9BO TaxID=3424759 RepID=UPI003D33D1DE